MPNSGDFKFEMDDETARLVISTVYPEDEGMYTCIASNALGKAYTSSCLVVDGNLIHIFSIYVLLIEIIILNIFIFSSRRKRKFIKSTVSKTARFAFCWFNTSFYTL